MTKSETTNFSYINAIGTAVPKYKIDQRQIADFFSKQLGLNPSQTHELKVLHRASGIKNRYSVLPDFQKGYETDFFKNNNFPKVSDRMLVYRQHAPELAKNAILNCIAENKDITLKDITHLITVSCTGMYAPGLGIELVESLEMNHHVQRTAINFMGCYGAFNGLKTADQICRAYPQSKVMVVCVELCSIHFQDSKLPDDLLSCTLFADGAAAVLVTAQPQNEKASLKLNSFYCDLYPDGKQDMSWQIGDFGFEMQLSSYVPALLGKGIEQLLSNLLSKADVARDSIDLFGIHPGGKRILEVIESRLDIARAKNKYAFEVLKNYGNMSSATVLFVLQLILEEYKETQNPLKLLAMAFGPGLTLESGLFEIIPALVANSKLQANEVALS